MRKKSNIKKNIIRLSCLTVVLVLLYLVLGATLPYVAHADTEKISGNEYLGESEYGERVRYIRSNVEALEIRLKLIREAKSEVILATFEFFDDESGHDIVSALADAASRGVKVKLLIDAYRGSSIKNNKWLRYLSSIENTEIKLYNPINPLFPWRSQSRMHEKYMIFDGKAFIIGGRNTNDRFLGDYGDAKESIDRDILVYTEEPGENASVSVLKRYFEGYFSDKHCKAYKYSENDMRETVSARYESLKTLYPSAFEERDIVSDTYYVGKVSLITGSTRTGNKKPEVWSQLVSLMSTGSNIVIQSPYIMCGKEMEEDLKELSEGRNVELVINSPLVASNRFGTADYLNNKDKVRGLGMTVFEHLGRVSDHSKTVLIDDRISVIGSYNLDMRSTYIDSEIMLVIDSERLNAELRSEMSGLYNESLIISPDGSVYEGVNYEAPEYDRTKSTSMKFMRLISRPIRFLI